MTNRIIWVDETKGLMLLWICIGHIDYSLSFILPLSVFFFLSGYLYNGNNKSVSVFIVQKTKSLLIPYILLSLLFPPAHKGVLHSIIFILKDVVSDHASSLFSYFKLFILDYIHYYIYDLRDFFYGKSSWGTSSMWFVWTLYCICVLFKCINHLIFKDNPLSLLIFSFYCLMAGWICNINSIHFLFNVETTLSCMPIFISGFLFRRYAESRTFLSYGFWSYLIFCIMVIVYGWSFRLSSACSYVHNDLGNNLLMYIISLILGIIITIKICKTLHFINSFNKCKRFLRIISVNSIIILPVHYWVQIVYNINCKELLPVPIYYISCLLLMVIISLISIPIFRRYLYWAIGKKKVQMRDCFDC